MVQASKAPEGSRGPGAEAGFSLDAQQIAFFEAFGFLSIPGLFADDIGWITEAFERVFATRPTWDTNVELHFNDKRSIIPAFIDQDPELAALKDDPRVTGIVASLLGDDVEYADSDGNCFYCDTSWHADSYSAPLEQMHLKLSFYLDPLSKETGAIRVIPGTNDYTSTFAKTMRRSLVTPTSVEEHYGIQARDVPSWSLETAPGDMVLWNFRTVHASFGGSARRRLFSINYRVPTADG